MRARGPESRRSARLAYGEFTVGAFLCVVVALSCVAVARHKAPYPLDERLLALIPHVSKNPGFELIARLGSAPAFVVGTLLAALVALRQHRSVALCCLLAPVITLAAVQLVAKPAVGRHLGGSLSFPSGHVAAATAIIAALAIATRGRWRLAVSVFGAAVALLVCVAVVSLGWHLPTDALAGLAAGAGGVVTIDGGRRVLGDAVHFRRAAFTRSNADVLTRAAGGLSKLRAGRRDSGRR